MRGRGSVSFDHLDHLSDERGLFEHAEGTRPRPEHGYCTDDNARLLVVTVRERSAGADADGVVGRLDALALRFVLASQDAGGSTRNRMDRLGRWTDVAGTDDCWGRSAWSLGTAAVHHPDGAARAAARRAFDRAVRRRSRWPRAMAFAALGAAEVARRHHDDLASRALLADALAAIGAPPPGAWVWPERRLTYANATLAEAVIAAADALGRPEELARGLAMLAWLLAMETERGHLSVAPVGGRGPGDARPGFDQQSIEVAALADACWRAHEVTGERSWLRGVTAAAGWFAGWNDVGAVMFDEHTGGGYDGLHAHGVNRNEGAESTLAYVSTMQRARALAPVA